VEFQIGRARRECVAHEAHRAEQSNLGARHAGCVGRRLVIVSEEVQKTVGEQSGELVAQRPAALLCLAAGGVDGYDHITQDT
jgi:hypothetical protein